MKRSSIGLLRLGETLCPITSVEMTIGGLLIRAYVDGPLPPDYGSCIIYTPDGQEAWIGASRVDVPALQVGQSMDISYDIRITSISPIKKKRGKS